MADLLRHALSVRPYLQGPIVTAERVRANSKRHKRDPTALLSCARDGEAFDLVVERQEPLPGEVEAVVGSQVALVWSVDLASLARVFGRIMRREPTPEQVEAASWACILRGRKISALELDAASATVNATGRRWGRFLEDFDVFVCPTTPTAAPPSGTPDQDDARFDTAGAWMGEVFARTPFTPIANLTGQPSISLPLGQANDGTPLGVMLTAQTLREDLLLRVAAQLELALPWAERRPAIDVATAATWS